jgi:ArsR family transcriptional regulator
MFKGSYTTENLGEVVRTLKGVAEPTRLRLLLLLSHGEFTVGELCAVLEQSQPRISRHLRVLTEAGLLDRFREQQCVYYRAPAAGRNLQWLRQLLAMADPDAPAVKRDRQRAAQVIRERARAAAQQLYQLEESEPESEPEPAPAPERGLAPAPGLAPAAQSSTSVRRAPRDAPADELAAVLLEELGPTSIGELLDVGTGSGHMLAILGPRAAHAVGVDISAPALRLARTRIHGAGLAHCEFRRGDMYSLPYEEACFDTVSIDHVLASAERPAAAIGEAARTLRAAGRLLIVEDFDQIDERAGGNPLLQLRRWLALAGMTALRLRPCDVAGRHLIVALAGHLNPRADAHDPDQTRAAAPRHSTPPSPPTGPA